METRQLGSSDLHITRIGFGAWAIGGGGWEYAWGAQDDQESIDAIHRIQATLGTATHLAGETKSYSVTYRNDGNRAESLAVTAAPPSGVTTTIEPSAFTLLPGATKQVSVTVAVSRMEFL